jgi:glycosyltransferase involved in cell wall biosynthesis
MLPKYGPQAASPRQRFHAYVPYLERSGIDVTVQELFSSRYLERYFDSGKRSSMEVIRAYLGRLGAMLGAGHYDAVMIHFEALPYLPGLPEWYLAQRNIPYILDFDDAIHHQYEQHANPLVRKTVGGKIASIVSRASAVTAGNDYIAEFASRAGCQRVLTLPTVIDPERYKPGLKRCAANDGTVTIGWMGSRSTAPYLQSLFPVIERLAAAHDVRLLIVGAPEGDRSGHGFPVEYRSWNEDREISDLNDMDIGIMPLPDTPWERGKCGYKLIQYMGVAKPVVASPVGVNRKIVEPGVNGFLAGTEDEWVEALGSLIENPALRADLGCSGRKKVEREYSLAVTAPKLIDLLQEVAAGQ